MYKDKLVKTFRRSWPHNEMERCEYFIKYNVMLNKLEWGLSEPNLEGRKNEFTRQHYKGVRVPALKTTSAIYPSSKSSPS